VRQIHFILRGSGDRSVRWGYLSVNQAALAEPPAPKRTTLDAPSAEEAAAILNEAWKQPVWGTLLWGRHGDRLPSRRTVLRSMGRCGSRPRPYIHREVDDSHTPGEEDQERAGSPGVYRSLYSGPLRAHSAAAEDQCAMLDTALPPNGFTFSLAPDFSEPIKPDTVTQKYRRLSKRNGLRSTRFHALRHYSATEPISSGIDIRTVSGRLRHGSGGTILRSVRPGSKRPSAEPLAPSPAPCPAGSGEQNPAQSIRGDRRRPAQSRRGRHLPCRIPPACE
jgi:integrase